MSKLSINVATAERDIAEHQTLSNLQSFGNSGEVSN